MDKYICTVCATIYNPALGVLEDGIAPGTPFEKIPENWMCTVCGSPKISIFYFLKLNIKNCSMRN